MKIANGRTDRKNPSMHLMLNYQDFKKFNAESLEEYTQSLSSMNLSDLQYHAIKVGVKATSDRKRIVKILSDEFIRAKSKYDLAVIKENKQFEETKQKETSLNFPIF